MATILGEHVSVIRPERIHPGNREPVWHPVHRIRRRERVLGPWEFWILSQEINPKTAALIARPVEK